VIVYLAIDDDRGYASQQKGHVLQGWRMPFLEGF